MKKSNLIAMFFALAVVIASVVAVLNPKSVSAQANNTEEIVFGQAYQTGEIPATDFFLYNMTVPKSGRITIAATNSGTEGRIFVYDEAGNELLYYTLYKGETESYSYDLLAGSYTVKFKDRWDYDGSANFSFRISFTDSKETVSESVTTTNNEIGFETAYTLGKTITGQLALNDKSDLYSFKVNNNGYVTVTIRSQQISKYTVKLIDEENQVSYSESVETGSHQLKFFAPKGNYYLNILKDNGSGTYSFVAKSSKLTATKLKKVKRAKYYYSYRSIKARWAKKGDASGYQIQVARNKKFTKGKKSFDVYSDYYSGYVIPYEKFKKKKYFVRVRYYITVDNHKYYSPWSNVKSIKLK